jgi:hypothetical protein
MRAGSRFEECGAGQSRNSTVKGLPRRSELAEAAVSKTGAIGALLQSERHQAMPLCEAVSLGGRGRRLRRANPWARLRRESVSRAARGVRGREPPAVDSVGRAFGADFVSAAERESVRVGACGGPWTRLGEAEAAMALARRVVAMLWRMTR